MPPGLQPLLDPRERRRRRRDPPDASTTQVGCACGQEELVLQGMEAVPEVAETFGQVGLASRSRGPGTTAMRKSTGGGRRSLTGGRVPYDQRRAPPPRASATPASAVFRRPPR